MAASLMNVVIQHLRRAALRAEGAERTDGQLLESFVRHGETGALESLVQRHGPMVWGVCRRILRQEPDAEDAFQATFLVLVRKAAAIVPAGMVGNWLYGVAYQTAIKARATRAKRHRREAQLPTMPEPAVTETDLGRDLLPLLDQELAHLPDRYRAVLVLCDLEGKTRQEAAHALGCPEGTVGSRLARARALLARRLARHGLPVVSATLAAGLCQQAATATVPAQVLSSTIKTITLAAAGHGTAIGIASGSVAALTEGVIRTMFLNKLMKLTGLLLLVAALGVGASGLIHRTKAADPSEAAKKEPKKPSGGVVLQGGSKFENPEMEKLQGAWQTEALVGPQGPVSRERLRDQLLVIDGQKYVRKEKGKTIMEGMLAIDTAGKQKALVMIATDRKTGVVWALYKLDGDKLTVCYELLGKGRPDRFEASKTQSVATYKRRKEPGARPGPRGQTRNPRTPAADAVPKEVSGKWITPLQFPEATQAKVAAAALALLASCHYAHVPNEGPMPDWDDLRLDARNRWCHLYFHLAKPQTITTATDEKVTVTELLLVLGVPEGGLYVRVGDQAKRFGKYNAEAAIRLQNRMKEAEGRTSFSR